MAHAFFILHAFQRLQKDRDKTKQHCENQLHFLIPSFLHGYFIWYTFVYSSFFVQSSVKYLFFTCFFRNIAVFQIVYVYVQCTEIFYSILPHCARVPCKIMQFLPSARCDSPRHNESSGIPKRYCVLHEVPAICYCFYP